MTVLERIAEQRIADAQHRGAFDGLAGRGSPLHLDDDSGVPPEWRAAFRVLKNAGCVPEWIAMSKELERERGRLQAALAEGREADAALRAEAANLNRRIRRFNLLAPHASLQKPAFRV